MTSVEVPAGGRARRAPLHAVHLVALALILAAAALIYIPGLSDPFFADDYLFLDQVRDRPLATALVTPDPLSNFYRPISRQLYFWLVSHASGESFAAFHATSIALFLVVLVLLFALVHRLAGPNAGLIACGFLALHYAPDVAVRWASGSQELFAILFALTVIILHLAGRRWWAALAMLLAALSKEIILLTPLIAAALDRRPYESWRAALIRAWPMAIAIAIWMLLWIVMPQRRAEQGAEVAFNGWGPLAVLLHFVQVAFGAEWRSGEPLQLLTAWPPLVPLALVLVAIGGAWWLSGRGQGVDSARAQGPDAAQEGTRTARKGARKVARDAPAPRAGAAARPAELRRLIVIGIGWALLATAPVAMVAVLWSAYYYTFAMCGVALALAAWLVTRPRSWTLVAIALLAWGSSSARSLQEFSAARSPWAPQSRINQFHMKRATGYVARYLDDLKAMHPTFPRGSTLFHTGVPPNIAFQVADGPLVRWAYRDSSLRSYFLSAFGRDKLGRGPVYFFIASGDTLREMEGGEHQLYQIALGLVLNESVAAARDALQLDRESGSPSPYGAYLLAWLQWELGEREQSAELLRGEGVALAASPAPDEVARALAAFQAGDTLGATAIAQQAVVRNGLDAGIHALVADLRLLRNPQDPAGIVDAYAARVLSPDQPSVWRRWGLVQVHTERYLNALAAFERYFELGQESVADDREAKQWMTQIREQLAASTKDERRGGE